MIQAGSPEIEPRPYEFPEIDPDTEPKDDQQDPEITFDPLLIFWP